MNTPPHRVLELIDFAYTHLTRLFPPVCPHPEADRLEADVRQWALTHGLNTPGNRDQLARYRIGHMIACCMPDTPVAVVRITAHYLAWMFVFDETIAEDEQRLDDHLALDLPGLLRTGKPVFGTPLTGLPNTLAVIREEVIDAGGQGLLPRLASGLQRTLDACAREVPWRRTRRPPTLGDYLRDRVATSGGHGMHLQQLSSGMPPLTEPLPGDLAGLADAAILVGALANDLLGFVYDQQRDDPVNVVTVLAHEYALATPDAYRAAVVLHAAHAHRFDTDRARIAADPRLTGPQRRMAAAIGNWVNGAAAALEPFWRNARGLLTQQAASTALPGSVEKTR